MVFFIPKSPYEGMCTCSCHLSQVTNAKKLEEKDSAQVIKQLSQQIPLPRLEQPIEYSKLLENAIKADSMPSIFKLFFLMGFKS